MKPPQFFITLILASLTLVLSIVVIWQGQSLSSLQMSVQKEQLDIQTSLQKSQEVINLGNQSQQVGANILKDIATAAIDPAKGSVRNEKLKAVLEKNGITVQLNQPSPTPAPVK
jgi:predicted Holliday junction resolvase-like endonuclease